eukprot:gnl/TRDRNA2_/TRDRNA2_169572_c1_seq1.p1 gnl/TRDRNA2_/TRDRNA2_169572_c1~~gnl/TRDRNA2_/TRDRNA2_169572_c1_seq1.p1  ORF type:complete len:289 (+),score=60.34 gnl/TRDRNA2_/TRDRNA2_169572_c1_seq1:64-867(+)
MRGAGATAPADHRQKGEKVTGAECSASVQREKELEAVEPRKRRKTAKSSTATPAEQRELDEAAAFFLEDCSQELEHTRIKKGRKRSKMAAAAGSREEQGSDALCTGSVLARTNGLAADSFGQNRILILEEVHGSFNLGKILRSCEAFRITEVLCVMQSAAARSCVRSSIGAMFHLRLSVMESAAEAVSHCRRHGIRLIATTPHCDQELAACDFSAPCAVAVGNEADGLSRELLAGADSRVRIEMFGTVESLNVAVATGIVLHALATR